MKAMNHMDFSSLLAKVLSKLPSQVDTSAVTFRKNAPDLYEVSGLYELGEELAEHFDGDEAAILLATLCDAIISITRSASLFVTQVDPMTLRHATIQKKFETDLIYMANEPKLGWQAEDIQLAKEYLVQSPT